MDDKKFNTKWVLHNIEIKLFNGQFVFVNYKWTNPFKPDFTIVIFIHYKPRIAVAILDL